MNHSLYEIPFWRLSLAFIPLVIVVIYYGKLSLDRKTTLYATARMFLQLSAVGFVLRFLFTTDSSPLLVAVLLIMLAFASWISLHSIKEKRGQRYFRALLALSIGCIPTLAIVIFGVIDLTPWHQPKYLIPLAGMIFSNSMNALSLAAERFDKELSYGHSVEMARRTSLEAALIPLTNSFLAVGIVSFPGMMTGQILAGAEPLLAARYQIMVLAMAFGASGLSAMVYLLRSGDPSMEAEAKGSLENNQV